MQQELSKYLAELLHQHSRLSVPGLGTFELQHAPALIDQVQGQVSAPAKQIRFNDNLVMDDGVLVAFIQSRLGWSLTQTKQWLEQQVGEIKSALDRREIVELAGVGRFFRNFENQLQFVAENVNFNLDSYGLQPVIGQIISRAQAEKIPAIQNKVPPTPTAVPNTTSVPGDDLLDWLKANMNWLLAVLLLLVLIAVFLFYPRAPQAPVYDEQIAELPQERLNASPSKTPEEDTAAPPTHENDEGTVDAISPAEENTSREERPVSPPQDAPDTESPTLSPEEHTAVIAVGLFGNQNNVQRLLERLSKAGYAPISRPEGDNTRVGVTVRFTEERELQAVFREVKRNFASSAYIMTRDGREVREQ